MIGESASVQYIGYGGSLPPGLEAEAFAGEGASSGESESLSGAELSSLLLLSRSILTEDEGLRGCLDFAFPPPRKAETWEDSSMSDSSSPG